MQTLGQRLYRFVRGFGTHAACVVLGGFLLSSSCSRTGLPVDFRTQDEETLLECPGLAVDSLRLGEVRQMDLLFVIDNSPSMADKQQLLKDAVPTLVRRLANPLCISVQDPTDEVTLPAADVPCPDGYRREFDAIEDLHIGVITSSLGARGGDLCAPQHTTRDPETLDDHAHLLGTRPRGRSVPTYESLGFLAWDPAGEQQPPGENDIDRLVTNFQNLVLVAGEFGCGFEGTNEAWYRFLIDPAPYESVFEEGGRTKTRGVDQTVLRQRAAFLRPDSLVAIIVLSDENDCSVTTSGLGWLVGKVIDDGSFVTMPRATAACAEDPNSPCCRSCSFSEASPPAGCEALSRDPECRRGVTYASEEDAWNLRCFDHQRRFGFDLLYPTARYAVGLRSTQLCPDSQYLDADCSCRAVIERARSLGKPEPPCTRRETGEPVPNPLYANLSPEPAFGRDRSQVFLAAIVGVPWQDIATKETLNDASRLEYLHVSEFDQVDPELGFTRWDLILGNLETFKPPLDPFMLESIDERNGQNPITGDVIVGSSSTDPFANSINGHERSIPARADLQYACIFPLENPKECRDDEPCDCSPSDPADTNPLCQPPGGGVGRNTQFFAKAYPGLRHLDILRRHGNNSVVASICPKLVSARPDDVGFGYRPALAGLVKRLRCVDLGAQFDKDPASIGYGTVPCSLIAMTPPGSGACSCDGVGRAPAQPHQDLAVRAELQARGLCGVQSGVDCSAFCLCEIPQTRGFAREACQNDASGEPVDSQSGEIVTGWCYVDPAAGFGRPELVEGCPAGNLRNVRLLGNAKPQAGETLFVACGEACSM